mgnify:CR=1 FL=1
MSSNKYQELQENIKLRNKILNLGFCQSNVGPTGPRGADGLPGDIGPTGPRGEIGPTGPIAVSSSEGLFSTGFVDTTESIEMNFENSWLIPNESEYFTIVSENEVLVEPGIYEITLSGLIEQADDTHGATFYLKNSNGEAIKDLSFELLAGNGKQMSFSQTIVFRFEESTILQVIVDILGDNGTSNVKVSGVNLLMKKIHE